MAKQLHCTGKERETEGHQFSSYHHFNDPISFFFWWFPLLFFSHVLFPFTVASKPSSDDSEYQLAVPSGNEVLEETLDGITNTTDTSGDPAGKDCDGVGPHVPSRQTLEAYQALLQKLQGAEAAALVNGMRNYLRKLSTMLSSSDRKVDPATTAKAFHSYIDSTFDSIDHLPESSSSSSSSTTTAGGGNVSREDMKAALESFLYGQAHGALWSCTVQPTKDQDCLDRCQSLAFLEPKHLDVACLQEEGGESSVPDEKSALPTAALLSMEAYYSPYEKLQRILATYREVNVTLQRALNANNSDNNKKEQKLPSADDVLPTLILTVLRAQPTSIVSDLQFIETFATSEHLRGEAGYAFTNLYGAVQFLLDLPMDEPSSNLSIDPAEYRKGLEECRSKMMTKQQELLGDVDVDAALNRVGGIGSHELEQQQEGAVVGDAESGVAVPPAPVGGVSIPVNEVRAARLRGEVLDLDWARQHSDWDPSLEVTNSMTAGPTGESSGEDENLRLPSGFSRTYSFLATQPDDVRLVDLPQLLDEYKMLARTVEVLLAERASKASQERKERMRSTERTLRENAVEAGMSVTTLAMSPKERRDAVEKATTTTKGTAVSSMTPTKAKTAMVSSTEQMDGNDQ